MLLKVISHLYEMTFNFTYMIDDIPQYLTTMASKPTITYVVVSHYKFNNNESDPSIDVVYMTADKKEARIKAKEEIDKYPNHDEEDIKDNEDENDKDEYIKQTSCGDPITITVCEYKKKQ